MIRFLTGEMGGMEFAYQSAESAADRWDFLAWYIEMLKSPMLSRSMWRDELLASMVEFGILSDWLGHRRNGLGRPAHRYFNHAVG